MKGPIAKCGMDCGACASYRPNLRTFADRRRVSRAWAKYFGFKLDPRKLRRCVGCQASGSPRYVNCALRRCALHSRVKTCAHCCSYPCDELKHRTPNEVWVKSVRRRVGAIPKQDFRDFIAPYIGLANLDRVRKKLRPGEIAEPLPFRVNPKVVGFPQSGIPQRQRASYRAVHRLVSAIKTLPADTWAKHLALEKYRRDLLHLLWTFGLHGRRLPGARPRLELDAAAYRQERNLTSRSTVEQVYLAMLRRLGASVRIIVLDKDRWLTEKGALRGEGWKMLLFFSSRAGGPDSLTALRRWCRALYERYGSRGFAWFAAGDLRPLAR